MRVETCYFCSQPCYPPRASLSSATMPASSGFAGVNAIKTSKMKRNPRKLKWTKAFRKSAGKEMVVDSTLQFAARRNVPVRYNRDHIATTLQAMERVSEIRARRERVFYKRRMAGNKERQREIDRKIVAENEHLLPRERGSDRLSREARERGEEAMEDVTKDVVLAVKQKKKQKAKQRLLVEGGVQDEMDVD